MTGDEMLSLLKRAFRAPKNHAQSDREKAAYRTGQLRLDIANGFILEGRVRKIPALTSQRP
jgi:hypothetical protein